MQLDCFLVCDAATTSEGKIYLHGAGISRITVPTVPFVIPFLTVLGRYQFDSVEESAREYELAFSVTDDRGQEMAAPMKGRIRAQSDPGLRAGEEIYTNLILGFGPLPIQRTGSLRIRLALGDTLREMTLPIVVTGAAPVFFAPESQQEGH